MTSKKRSLEFAAEQDKGKCFKLDLHDQQKIIRHESMNSVDLSRQKLERKFYTKECTKLAKDLLGKKIVRYNAETNERISGTIVETEAYLGFDDKAAHSYKGKKTERTEAMFMEPGTAYVYNIYGMYCCMNISSDGEGAAVLVRALDPNEGKETMQAMRSKKEKTMKDKELCSGPSKLCQALAISKKDINKEDMTNSTKIWLEDGEDMKEDQIVISKRINIDKAEEWVDKPLRFYVLGNSSVSVRDKKAEKSLASVS